MYSYAARISNSLGFCVYIEDNPTWRIPPNNSHRSPASAGANSHNADYGRSSSALRSVNDTAPGRYVSFQINSNVPSLGLTVAGRLNESCGGRHNRTPPSHAWVIMCANSFQYPNNDRWFDLCIFFKRFYYRCRLMCTFCGVLWLYPTYIGIYSAHNSLRFSVSLIIYRIFWKAICIWWQKVNWSWGIRSCVLIKQGRVNHRVHPLTFSLAVVQGYGTCRSGMSVRQYICGLSNTNHNNQAEGPGLFVDTCFRLASL